jgi:hypothetical protein
MNTFKKPNKTTGTAHSSDGETVNTNNSLISSIPILNNDDKNEIETISNESSLIIDEKNRFNHSNSSSQQPIKISQQLNESTHFDPLISTDNDNLQELETLLKSTFQKTFSNQESITISPQISSTNDEISDLKSLIIDLRKNLLNKMNIIENKIDDHFSQTRKMNHILTNTILPSLVDLTDIIQQTPLSNQDINIRTKLENIKTRIHITQQQQQQTEMKDLMDI